MAPKKKPKVSFEEGIGQLESMVDQMQRGELPLDQLMNMYEEGMTLASQLEEMIRSHRKRIEQIDPDTAEITTFEEIENGVQ